MAREEEDRPPIIVKGGSLIVQSGDETSENPKHRKGKRWKKRWPNDKKRWRQDHAAGKRVAEYLVTFETPKGVCGSGQGTPVVVTYQADMGPRAETVTIGVTTFSKRPEPFIESTADLTEDNRPEQPTLTLSTPGQIVSIRVGDTICSSPTVAKLYPLHPVPAFEPPAGRTILIGAVIAALALGAAYLLGAFDRGDGRDRR